MHKQTIYSVILITLLFSSGCALGQTYTPDIEDSQRESWLALREGLSERRFVDKPLSQKETQLVESLLDTWRGMPRMTWVQGRVMDVDGKPITGTMLWKETSGGTSFNNTFKHELVELDETGRFNWNAPAGARFSVTAEGYSNIKPNSVPYWPGRPPKKGTPLEKVLQDRETLRRLDDLVIGRDLVLFRKSDATVLDQCIIELPLNKSRPIAVFRYDWAQRWDQPPGETLLEDREVAQTITGRTRSDIEAQRRIGNQLLTDDQWDRLQQLPEDRWVEVLGPCMVILAEMDDESSEVASVLSEKHEVRLRDAEGKKVVDRDPDANQVAKRPMRSVVWPSKIRVLFLGKGNGSLPLPEIKEERVADSEAYKLMHTSPEDGYLHEIVLTHEDFDSWTDQQKDNRSAAKNGSYFYVRIDGLYGNLRASIPYSTYPNVFGMRELGMPAHDSQSSIIRFDLAIQPNGTNNLLELHRRN